MHQLPYTRTPSSVTAALLLVTSLVSITGCTSKPPVPLPEQPPVIAISEKPTWIKLHDYWQQSPQSVEGTVLSIRSDEQTLQLDFYASDRAIQSTHTERDSETFRDDCIEIFLASPELHPSKAIGIEINTLGAISDYLYIERNKFDHQLNLKNMRSSCKAVDSFPAGIQLKAPGYHHTVQIDLIEIKKILDIPSGSDWLRANFGRWNTTKGKRTFTIWSDSEQSRPHPHNTKQYGWLQFK